MPGEDWTRGRVLETFGRWEAAQPEQAAMLDSEALDYLQYHALRYARLLGAVEDLARKPPGTLTILDVGPNLQTALLRTAHPEAIIDTLGFAHPAVPPRPHEHHIPFDLNDAGDPDRRPVQDRRYDVIVLAEVLEHLYTPASSALAFLGGWLGSPGSVLIQTPNGAALHKRLALLRGRSPVEPPRACRENPGHYHEYTVAELQDQVRAGGLAVESVRVENYFATGRAAELYRQVGTWLPATLRHGIMLCAGADSSSS